MHPGPCKLSQLHIVGGGRGGQECEAGMHTINRLNSND